MFVSLSVVISVLLATTSANGADRLVGRGTGNANVTGNCNTFLGSYAGYTILGSSNVFIDYGAGYSETGSNKLRIHNTSVAPSLIYGEFDNKKSTIKGNLDVTGPDNGLLRLSNVTTNNTTKVSRIVLHHYDNNQSPVYLFGAASTASDPAFST